MLRLVLELDGEVVQRADPMWACSIVRPRSSPRQDLYPVVALYGRAGLRVHDVQRTGLLPGHRKLLGIEVPLRAKYIRTMFGEITRLLNHLMWLGSNGMDLGASTVLMYTFREREDLFDMYEAVSGARMHAAYYRPGGVYRDPPDSMAQLKANKVRSAKATMSNSTATARARCWTFIEDFCAKFPNLVDEYETLLTENRIWKQRTVGIGVVSPERALNLGMTGVMLRGSGVAWDLRKKQPTMLMTAWISISRWAERRLLRSLPGARGRNAPVQSSIIKRCVKWLHLIPGPGHCGNHRWPPIARQKMAWKTDSPLQAVLEGFTCPRARLCAVPSIKRRVWHLS